MLLRKGHPLFRAAVFSNFQFNCIKAFLHAHTVCHLNGKPGTGIELENQWAFFGIKDNVCTKVAKVGDFITVAVQLAE